jgi:hypothetical protein
MTGSLSTCCLIRKAPSPKGAAGRCARPVNNGTPYYKLICTILTTDGGIYEVSRGPYASPVSCLGRNPLLRKPFHNRRPLRRIRLTARIPATRISWTRGETLDGSASP